MFKIVIIMPEIYYKGYCYFLVYTYISRYQDIGLNIIYINATVV